MKKTKIEWCDSTWNPVTGCLHGCEYCYARRIANRFSYEGQTLDAPQELQRVWLRDGKNDARHASTHVLRYPVDLISGRTCPYPFGFAPTFHRYRLDGIQRWQKPQTIFVCSMADLFGEWVPDEWIEEVFAACEKAPQHRYLFLTKNPFRYEQLHQKGILRKSDNMWYGYSATNNGYDLWFDNQYNCFVSIEPLLGEVEITDTHWVIIGAETGNRNNKVVPQKEWIESICRTADEMNVPVFMKNSLIPVVGEENMRREFPW